MRSMFHRQADATGSNASSPSSANAIKNWIAKNGLPPVLSWTSSANGRARSVLREDRKSTRLNSSHTVISYAVFCLKKKNRHRVGQDYETELGTVALQRRRVVAQGAPYPRAAHGESEPSLDAIHQQPHGLARQPSMY